MAKSGQGCKPQQQEKKQVNIDDAVKYIWLYSTVNQPIKELEMVLICNKKSQINCCWSTGISLSQCIVHAKRLHRKLLGTQSTGWSVFRKCLFRKYLTTLLAMIHKVKYPFKPPVLLPVIGQIDTL